VFLPPGTGMKTPENRDFATILDLPEARIISVLAFFPAS
jgi:hypothetical protein